MLQTVHHKLIFASYLNIRINIKILQGISRHPAATVLLNLYISHT